MKDSLKIGEEISRIDGQIESNCESIRALENEVAHLRERKREAEALLNKPEESDDAEAGSGD